MTPAMLALQAEMQHLQTELQAQAVVYQEKMQAAPDAAVRQATQAEMQAVMSGLSARLQEVGREMQDEGQKASAAAMAQYAVAAMGGTAVSPADTTAGQAVEAKAVAEAKSAAGAAGAAAGAAAAGGAAAAAGSWEAFLKEKGVAEADIAATVEKLDDAALELDQLEDIDEEVLEEAGVSPEVIAAWFKVDEPSPWIEWLTKAGVKAEEIPATVAAFEKESIDLDQLPDLDKDTLKELGIKMGVILRILKAAK